LRPWIFVLGRPRSAFQVCGLTGFVLAIVLAGFVTARLHLSLAVLAALIATAVMTFLALAMATKVWTGPERLVYYHHAIAVVVGVGVVVQLLGRPVLPYLDITVLALGLFLGCGRCGCLMVGCCYGRPWRRGVVYSSEHSREGFPECFVHARLFPVQLLESFL